MEILSAAAESGDLTWPEAAVLIAFFCVIGFGLWVAGRND